MAWTATLALSAARIGLKFSGLAAIARVHTPPGCGVPDKKPKGVGVGVGKIEFVRSEALFWLQPARRSSSSIVHAHRPPQPRCSHRPFIGIVCTKPGLRANANGEPATGGILLRLCVSRNFSQLQRWRAACEVAAISRADQLYSVAPRRCRQRHTAARLHPLSGQIKIAQPRQRLGQPLDH